MRMIKRLSEDIRCNIDEARDKILTAYDLHDENPQAASWYKEMAAAHLNFNTNGHAIITKLIGDYKTSEEYKMHPEYADGMMAVWNAEHADLIKRSAEVQSMISTYK